MGWQDAPVATDDAGQGSWQDAPVVEGAPQEERATFLPLVKPAGASKFEFGMPGIFANPYNAAKSAEEKAWSGADPGALVPDVTNAALGTMGAASARAIAPIAATAPAAGLELTAGALARRPTFARLRANAPGSAATAAEPAIPPSAQATSDQIIANQLRRAGRTPDDIERMLNDAAAGRKFGSSGTAQDAIAPVDWDPALQRLAGSLTRSSPEAANTASDFMFARQTGQVPARGDVPPSAGLPTRAKFAPQITGKQAQQQFGTDFGAGQQNPVPMGQFERVQDALKRAFQIKDTDFHGHAANANRTDQQIITAAREEAKPAYAAVYNAGENVNIMPELDTVLQKWMPWSPAQSQVIAREAAPVQQAVKKAADLFQPNGKLVSNIEQFDKTKQYLDGVIEKYFNSPSDRNNRVGGILNDFKNDLLGAVDGIQDNGLGAAYKDARGLYSSRMESREAIQAGRDAAAGDADSGVDAYRALGDNPGNQKLFRLGVLGQFEKQFGRASRATDVTKFFDNPNVEGLLSEIIPSSQSSTAAFADRPQRFGQYLGNEKTFIQTRNQVAGNSKTAERLQDDSDFDRMQSLIEGASNPQLLNYAVRAAKWALNKFFGYRADTADAMSRDLFTADPDRRSALLARLRPLMGDDRFTYFKNMMMQQMERAKAGGPLGGATFFEPSSQNPPETGKAAGGSTTDRHTFHIATKYA